MGGRRPVGSSEAILKPQLSRPHCDEKENPHRLTCETGAVPCLLDGPLSCQGLSKDRRHGSGSSWPVSVLQNADTLPVKRLTSPANDHVSLLDNKTQQTSHITEEARISDRAFSRK